MFAFRACRASIALGAVTLFSTAMSADASCITYTTSVVTGFTPEAGVDENVEIKFIGANATYTTTPHKLTEHNGFKRDATNTFSRCLAEDMGKPLILFVGSDTAAPDADWFLSEVMITSDDPAQRHLGIFSVNQWITADTPSVTVPCQYCRWSPDTMLQGTAISETVQQYVDGAWREIAFTGSGAVFGG